MTSSEAWLTENAISEKTWQNRQVYHEETKKHLEGGLGLKTQFLTDQTMLHLNYIVVLAVMVFAALTSRWILLGVSVAALVLSLMLRIVNGKRALQAMGVSIPSWKVIPYEWSMLFRNIMTRFRYEYADKNDFISHKV